MPDRLPNQLFADDLEGMTYYGKEIITDLSSSVGLTVPDTNAYLALVYILTAGIYYDIGVEAAASTGFPEDYGGTPLVIVGKQNLADVRFIQASAGAEIRVQYHGSPEDF